MPAIADPRAREIGPAQIRLLLGADLTRMDEFNLDGLFGPRPIPSPPQALALVNALNPAAQHVQPAWDELRHLVQQDAVLRFQAKHMDATVLGGDRQGKFQARAAFAKAGPF